MLDVRPLLSFFFDQPGRLSWARGVAHMKIDRELIFRRGWRRILRLVGLLALVGFAFIAGGGPSRAEAHPLGNYSINQYLLLNLRGKAPEIYYLLDMAEIPSFPELDLIDSDFDSVVTDGEEDIYLKAKIPSLAEKIRFSISGKPIPLKVLDQRLSLQEGSGGMIVINILVKLAPSLSAWPPDAHPIDIELVSENHIDSSGVRELKIFLGRAFDDRTKQLGKKMLGYQTEIFVDRIGNPVYEDFDCQFLLRLGLRAEDREAGEDIPLGFSWTRTARSSTDSGDNITWGKAFSDFRTLENMAVDETGTARPINNTTEAAVTQSGTSEITLTESSPGDTKAQSKDAGTGQTKAQTPATRAASGPQPASTQGLPEAADQPSKAPLSRKLDKGNEGLMGTMFAPVTNLIRTPDEELTPTMFMMGLLVAMVLGMAHARSPGHGKTIMAAYLIGERGTAWNALVLGIVVTITHTWSVIALGLIALSAAESVSEEQLSFWLGIASGIIIIVIGIILFARRYRGYLLSRHNPSVAHDHDHHGTDHDHNHGPMGHTHVVTNEDGTPPSFRHILWLGISGGIVPCPSALIVLLLALRFGRLQYGLWLIVSFSLGLASVLVIIGLVVVFASGRLRKYTGQGNRFLTALPVFSSAMIAILGLWVVIWTLFQYDIIVFKPGL
jgi:ABC-type nickel/cobalt efflux system permease component RcnA